MFDIFEQIKEMEKVKTTIKDFCGNIAEIYNKYSKNKINTNGKFHSIKISKFSDGLVCVRYNFIRDLGDYVINDPNDEGDRSWEEDLQVVEEKICFPKNVFLGLTQPEEYSLEYVEQEIKKFVEEETQRMKKEEEREKLFSSFKSSSLSLNYAITPEEQFHIMLMAFLTDVRNCFNSYQWFANKYIRTEKYSHQVESTVKTILKNCYQDNEESLFSEVLGNLRSQVPAILQLWENNGDNCYYELDKMAEDIYDFNYCPHMNSKKYRAEAKEKVDNLINDLCQKGFIKSKTVPTDSRFKDYMLKYIAMCDTTYMIILRNGILKDFIVDFDSNNTLSNIYAICEKIFLLEADAVQHKDIIKPGDYKRIKYLVYIARDLIHFACQITTGMDTKQLEFYDIDNGFGVNLFEELREKFKRYDM